MRQHYKIRVKGSSVSDDSVLSFPLWPLIHKIFFWLADRENLYEHCVAGMDTMVEEILDLIGGTSHDQG